MKTVFCFGDSNTWGFIPLIEKRLPRDKRWTGILQNSLGDDYYVIEAGLNSRTTAFDDPIQPYRNGLNTVRMLLMQADPIDLITIMLGSNDVKNYLGQNACTVTKGMDLLIKTIKSYYSEQNIQCPKLLLISPIHIAENIEQLPTGTEFNATSAQITRELASNYEILAKTHGIYFMDASKIASPSIEDGLHMTEEGHAAFAAAIEKKILEILV